MGLTKFLSDKKSLYWTAQILGWAVFFLLVYYTNDNITENKNWFPLLLTLYVMSILETHMFRFIILRFDWFRFKPVKILIITTLGCLVLGFVDEVLDTVISILILKDKTILSQLTFGSAVVNVVLSSMFFIMWSAIYFAFHFVGKAREEEIKNIQFEASKTEIELKNLKSQLNPHFMFNSMNSIRALIDEDPVRAKFAVTQLSSILRNTLLMGKNKTVSVKDELNIVKDYLSLEGIRYEERLIVHYKIDDSLLTCEIPPLMIQTLVENAIKHGISKLTTGGHLTIRVNQDKESIVVTVENSGDVDVSTLRSGIGLRNTRKRLELLYGDRSKFSISAEDGVVITKIIIPKIEWHESDNSR